ncbi:MAG TPA: FadR/GntR family transcriptional regulator [Pirellulaceae bacterium]|nr:FadR/GntR family transcriptional regulator [Pirellulaceae bacterium]
MTSTAEPLLDSTVKALRERILSGAYSAGVLPPQGALCDELGVSRSVIREAMRQLQSQRLIEVSQGAPARVLPAGPAGMADSLDLFMRRTETSLAQLSEVRLPLEAEIVALAAERIDDEGLLRLHIAVRRLREGQTLDEQINADLEFHRVLAEATGNPIFVFLLDALAVLMRESRQQTIGRVGIGPAVSGHLAILQGVQKRNVKAARAAMVAHIQDSIRDLEIHTEQEPSS